VAEHHLGEAALQRTLQDVVPGSAHVDVPVVSPGALRIDGSHAASGLGELRIQKGQLNIRPLWESIILYYPYYILFYFNSYIIKFQLKKDLVFSLFLSLEIFC